nr:hypothetical protein [Spiroplasma tabanidicola]
MIAEDCNPVKLKALDIETHVIIMFAILSLTDAIGIYLFFL